MGSIAECLESLTANAEVVTIIKYRTILVNDLERKGASCMFYIVVM
jgi:hypothetical protein